MAHHAVLRSDLVGDCLLVEASRAGIDPAGLREFLAEWSETGGGRPALLLVGHVDDAAALASLVDTGLLSGICVDGRRAMTRAAEVGGLWRARASISVRAETKPCLQRRGLDLSQHPLEWRRAASPSQAHLH